MKWFVYISLTLVILIGVALPFIGWVTLVPFAAYAMDRYRQTQRELAVRQAWITSQSNLSV